MNVINNRFRRNQQKKIQQNCLKSRKKLIDSEMKKEFDQTDDSFWQNSKKYHSSFLENKKNQYKLLQGLLKERWLQNPLIAQRQQNNRFSPLSSLRNDYHSHQQTMKQEKSLDFSYKFTNNSVRNHLRNLRPERNIQVFQNLKKEEERRQKYISLKKEQPVRVTISKKMTNFYRKNMLEKFNQIGDKSLSILQKDINRNQVNPKNSEKSSRKGSFQKPRSSLSTLENRQVQDLTLKKEESIRCKGDILLKEPFHTRRKFYLHNKEKYQTQQAIFLYIVKS